MSTPSLLFVIAGEAHRLYVTDTGLVSLRRYESQCDYGEEVRAGFLSPRQVWEESVLNEDIDDISLRFPLAPGEEENFETWDALWARVAVMAGKKYPGE